MNNRCTAVYAVLLLAVTGCASPLEKVKQNDLPSSNTSNLTLGVVQKNIKHGMAQDEVATYLGSPNMVTKDGAGLETWIYDKISTEVVTASAGNDQKTIGGLLGSPNALGSSVSGAAIATASQYNNASSLTRTQKTLTVIIKFKENRVADYTYRASAF